MAVSTIFHPFKPQYLPDIHNPLPSFLPSFLPFFLPSSSSEQQTGLKIFHPRSANFSSPYLIPREKDGGDACTNVDSSIFHRRRRRRRREADLEIMQILRGEAEEEPMRSYSSPGWLFSRPSSFFIFTPPFVARHPFRDLSSNWIDALGLRVNPFFFFL